MLHLLINALQVNIGAEINIAEQVPTAIPKEMIKLKSLTIPVQISTKGREARRVVPDIDKGGTRVIVQYKEDSLVVENKRLDNLGSKLEIESIDQTSREIDLESKSGTLEYDDTYQVRYYTEPDDNYHNLEINII